MVQVAEASGPRDAGLQVKEEMRTATLIGNDRETPPTEAVIIVSCHSGMRVEVAVKLAPADPAATVIEGGTTR